MLSFVKYVFVIILFLLIILEINLLNYEWLLNDLKEKILVILFLRFVVEIMDVLEGLIYKFENVENDCINVGRVFFYIIVK